MARPSMREQIVDAAFEQFHLHGFNACGVKLITDSAQVPKGSFYNHFESKEALAVVVMQRYRDESRAGDLLESTPAPLTRLRRHFEFHGDRITGYGYDRGCMFGNFSNETADHVPAIRDEVLASFDQWREAIATVLREAQHDGTLSAAHDPEILSRFILNAWEGAVTDARTTKNDSPFASFFSVVFDTLLH